MADAKTVNLSSPERVLFPEDGITKGDLFEYYKQVGPTIVPHLRDRPFTMKRYREGIDAPGFFQYRAVFPARKKRYGGMRVCGALKTARNGPLRPRYSAHHIGVSGKAGSTPGSPVRGVRRDGAATSSDAACSSTAPGAAEPSARMKRVAAGSSPARK